ncbi:MAG TPA: hypothetical protein VLT88_01840, partial [Desulfosarcina sp.]|nr:hypothetical protein [Desulfosarcina sp.]
MNERSRILLMIWLMTVISLMITGVTIASLYRTAVQEERRRLVETVQSQARIIEAMARFDALNNDAYRPGGSRGATLAKLNEAHNNYEQAGMTMEVTLAERNGDWISYLIRHRHGGLEDYLKPISFDSERAVSMRLALSGQSGSIIAEDYRGEMVLAAYEPVGELNLGIVAKIDLSEIRAPFIQAGLIAGLFAVAVVGIGATLFFRIGTPLLDTIAAQNTELLHA